MPTIYCNDKELSKHFVADKIDEPLKADIIALHAAGNLTKLEVAAMVESCILRPTATYILRADKLSVECETIMEFIRKYTPNLYTSSTDFVVAVNDASGCSVIGTLDVLLETFKKKTRDEEEYIILCERVRSDAKTHSLFTIISALVAMVELRSQINVNTYREAREFVKKVMLSCIRAEDCFQQTGSNYLSVVAAVKGQAWTKEQSSESMERYTVGRLCDTNGAFTTDGITRRAKDIASIAEII